MTEGNTKMTEPTPAQDRPRYRAGQTVAYRVQDPITGGEIVGHGLVLKAHGDVVDLAQLGYGYVQAHVDVVSPAKVDDVPNPFPAPAEPAGDDSSS